MGAPTIGALLRARRKLDICAPPAYDVFQVSLGWCAAARSEKGICRFVLPVETADAAEAEILESVAVLRGLRVLRGKNCMHALARAVARYFDGRAADFGGFPVDLSSGTPFQQKVWSAIRRIPRGQVRTYKWIGAEIGRPDACRAIGRAVGANPVPLLVPCHRVVGSDGSLVGFSAAGGLELKARMLEIERVRFHGEGKCRRVTA